MEEATRIKLESVKEQCEEEDVCLQDHFPTALYITHEHSYARESVRGEGGGQRTVHMVIKNLPFTVTLALKDPDKVPLLCLRCGCVCRPLLHVGLLFSFSICLSVHVSILFYVCLCPFYFLPLFLSLSQTSLVPPFSSYLATCTP